MLEHYRSINYCAYCEMCYLLAHHNPVAAELPHNNGNTESGFPLALDSMIQTGQQIAALRSDPYTGQPDIKQPKWTEADKLATWEKGSPIPGKDESKVRRDDVGREMGWDEYGKDTVSQLSTKSV